MVQTSDLILFVAVAETGSFSAAGRRLALTPSTIGRAIDRIERRLGVRLVLRTTRSLTLTGEGATYLAAVRQMLADLADAERSISTGGAPHGRLRVSLSLLYGRFFVVPLLGAFARTYPNVLLEVNATDAVVDIAAGEADVGIRVGRSPDLSLTSRKLSETHKVVVASPAYLERRGTPMIPEDLQEHDCIGLTFRRAAPTWSFWRRGRTVSLPIQPHIETNNGETERQLVRDGLGVARVCAETVQEDIEAGHLVPLLERFNPGDTEEVRAVYVGGTHTPPRVRCFVDFLAGHTRTKAMIRPRFSP